MSDERERPREAAEQSETRRRDAEEREGAEINELDADNEVEQDTIETVDPDNPPA
ncbi:hypothetical protein EV379_2780 [Microterricola gilva]|uniref:Uncharacterized protein n=1 Tax=Microterricola gilva TaxID=393267 RepID=A0A4Q8AP61_9MICO|nr:hypothetical protein [Microterricola gilva]RZU66424.1 hypothetical protein EV379_2780 [Microterricola gilva]